MVQYICDFDKGGVHAIKHIFFAEGFWSRHHHEGFPVPCYVWADTRIGLIKLSLKISTYLKTCSSSFFQSTECFICALYPGNSFRGNWRSAATAGHNLILIEVDGKCQFVGDRIHLTKYVLDLYLENYTILLKEMNTNIHGLEDVSSLKMLWQIHCSASWNTCSFFFFFF